MTNLSVRAQVESAVDFVSVFTISPGPQKTLLLRAVGPSLASFGVRGALVDPKLALYDTEGGKIAENDDFNQSEAAIAASAGAFPLLARSKDAMIVTTLPAGKYTVRVSGVGGNVGTVLVEVYDLSGGTNRLTAFSSEAQVDAPENSIIAGFTLSPGMGTRRLLFRALGQRLRMDYVPTDAKVDPTIEIYSGIRKIAENDNWSAPQGGDAGDFRALRLDFARSGAGPLDVAGWDAAVAVDLAPGNYTVVARAARNHRGGVVVEAYEIPVDPNPEPPVPGLAVTEFTVPYENDGYFHQYYPRFTLVETSGQGPLTVISVALRPEGTIWYGPPHQWYGSLLVDAGGQVLVSGVRFSFEGGPILASSVTAILTYRLGDGSEGTIVANGLISDRLR